MPIDHSLGFTPPLVLRSGHTQSLLVARRKIQRSPNSELERIDTPDGDFLDLSWSRPGSKNLLILCHGLEGHLNSKYMLGMSRAFVSGAWDTLSWNYRSCSRELNRNVEMYHAGATSDLDIICQHVAKKNCYENIVLLGFSLGGNLVMLYGSEERSTLKDRLKGIIAFSAPVDLASSSAALSKGLSQLYTKHLLKLMKNKIERKAKQFPNSYTLDGLESISTFEEFDETYVAPVHGFKGARDYWEKCSAVFRLDRIKLPSLLVNALDDPFLGPQCYPFEQIREHPSITFQAPKYGGHTGFFETRNPEASWAEKRALQFANEIAG